MTVNAAPRSAGPFTGDGTNTSFPFGFKTLASDDLIVVVGGSLGETVLVKDTDYTVALNPDQGVTPGGTVTYPISGPAMDSQHRLSVISGVPYEQATTLPNGGPFNPVTIEKALDNLAMQTQQVVEKVGRSMQIPVTSPEDAEAMAQAVYNVNAKLAHVVGVDQNKTNIDAVAGNATNINTVAGNTTNINKVAAIDAAVTTVAAIDAAVTTVATNIADVGTVAANIANVNAAGANTSNINAVATDISNVNAVATNIASVNTVATDSANVATVATNIASVNTVAPNVGDVATVAADIVAVVDVSTNKATILNAATTAQKWAENPEDTAVTPGHYSALHWAAKAEQSVTGIVHGPLSATDGNIALFDGATGKYIKDSGKTLSSFLAASAQPTMRNRVINGGCLVAQRGAVAAVNNALTYGGCDRIAVAPVTFTTCSGTIQQGYGGVGRRGFSQAFTGVTTSGSGDIRFVTRLEAKDVADLNSKQITIQANFYQDSGSALACGFSVSKAGALDDFSSPTVISTGATTSVPSGATTAITTTFTMGASDCSNGLQIIAIFNDVGAVTGKAFHIADLQMEEGEVATPFEQRPYAFELALCQRYYEITTAIGTLAWTDTAGGRVVFRVDKRVPPTVSATAAGLRWYRTGVFDITSTSALTISGTSTSGAAIFQTVTGASAGAVLSADQSVLIASAEL